MLELITEDSKGCNKLRLPAFCSFPASTETNKSAGLFSPSFFNLSINSSAFAFITFTFIPVSNSKASYCFSSTV